MMLSKNEIFNIDITTLKSIHMIGISSPIASFCAELLLNAGVILTASEHNQDNEQAKKWVERKVLYTGPHSSKYINENINLVVFPNGPIPDNPECAETEKLNIPSVTLGQLLGLLTKDLKTIAIAGTHGKSTTASAIVYMLSKLDGLPNFVVGDSSVKINEINKNYNVNSKSKYFVVEACEYKRQFLDRAPKPYISVITNIELDHTDYYSSQVEYNKAFEEFISNTTNTLIMDLSNNNCKQVYKNTNYMNQVIDVSEYNNVIIESGIKGSLNQRNLIRAYLTGLSLGYSELDILNALKGFTGLTSRFEYIGLSKTRANIYFDYAHNPQKVAFCLSVAKETYPDKRIVFVFQPHSYERTNTFKQEFADSLDKADVILIPNIYSPARDKLDSALITVDEFVKVIKKKSPNKYVLNTLDFEKTASWINHNTTEKDIIVMASAGNLRDILPLIM